MFTISLLKDTGFFATIEEVYEGHFVSGKGKGCDFVYGSCEKINQFPEINGWDKCNYKRSGAGKMIMKNFIKNNIRRSL